MPKQTIKHTKPCTPDQHSVANREQPSNVLSFFPPICQVRGEPIQFSSVPKSQMSQTVSLEFLLFNSIFIIILFFFFQQRMVNINTRCMKICSIEYLCVGRPDYFERASPVRITKMRNSRFCFFFLVHFSICFDLFPK